MSLAIPFARSDINALHRSAANKLACHVTRCCGGGGDRGSASGGGVDGAGERGAVGGPVSKPDGGGAVEGGQRQ